MSKNFLEKYHIAENLKKEEIEKNFGKDFDPLLANLLFYRNIKNKKDADFFLNPKWEDNFSPFFFNDMEKICKRIFDAIKKKEKILIFSDYDTDGIPGGALFGKFFQEIGYENFFNFIPNRNKDGYGLTEKKAEKIIEGKIFENSEFGNFNDDLKNGKENFFPDLVITIDCGITDIKSAEILKKAKIDLIITDHHLPKEKLPDAFGILDHKILEEKYPDKNLCGAGTIFKLVQAMILKNKEEKIFEEKEGMEKWLLDLVAISTICDMVPLLGENRIFVKYGKIVIEKTKNIGLKKIIENARIDKKNISADDIGFMIGPRINAASRLEDPFFAFEALFENGEKSEIAADYLEKLNNQRKYLTAKIMKEVWKKLEDRKLEDVIVIGSKDWPLGVLGLIAGKISEKYKKPAFVWSCIKDAENKNLKGSCRSCGNYNIFSLMEKNEKDFIGFGGHSQSGGFEIEEQKIHFLEENLSKNLKNCQKIKKEKKIIDGEILLDDVNLENYKKIQMLEPFGMANQKPIFLFKNLEIFSVNFFGKEKNHLEIIFKNSKNFSIKAISFFWKDAFKNLEIKSEDKINLVASFELNTWNGNHSLRLKIEDIEISK